MNDDNGKLKVYRYIIRHKTENDGVSPSMQTIANALGMTSKTVAHRLVRALVADGALIMKGRAIQVVGGQWEEPSWWQYSTVGADITDDDLREMFEEKWGYPPILILREKTGVKVGPLRPARA
jgi:SOS-response transcriptional repressor LexA